MRHKKRTFFVDKCTPSEVGEQVAVKILYVDEMKRVHLSISEDLFGQER